MTDTEKQELKQRITEEMEKLQHDIAALEEATKPISPDNAYGRVSRIDAMNSKSVDENSLRMARGKMNRLQTALSKMDDPKFGQCTVCGKAIDPRRLMYMPGSTTCVNCAR